MAAIMAGSSPRGSRTEEKPKGAEVHIKAGLYAVRQLWGSIGPPSADKGLNLPVEECKVISPFFCDKIYEARHI